MHVMLSLASTYYEFKLDDTVTVIQLCVRTEVMHYMSTLRVSLIRVVMKHSEPVFRVSTAILLRVTLQMDERKHISLLGPEWPKKLVLSFFIDTSCSECVL